jgi:cyclopropane-fatty-acyl-phospholipid synthase
MTMTLQEPALVDTAVQRTLSLIKELLGGCRPRSFAVRLWDGTTWAPEPGQEARFTLVLQHPGALRRMFAKSSKLAIAEAFIYDDFAVEGQIEALVEVVDRLRSMPRGFWEKARWGRQLLRRPGGGPERPERRGAHLRGRKHSVERDRQAVSYHYDVSNEFYALFLDRSMTYSCAYFSQEGEDLDAAQERKLDYVCRKLRLQPGEKLLDIGCGWGGLARHAARRYGAEVLGITLSQTQASLANRLISEAGLAGRCRVELRDYRELRTPGAFDKLVSIGMVEHVGSERLPEYFGAAWELLRPGGAFLNHGIGNNAPAPPGRRAGFVGTYVFPDGELPPISAVLQAAERARFEVRDVENLREHYALTLRHWVRRLEGNRQDALRHVDEVTYRIWRLYMAAAAWRFSSGKLNLYQSLLVKQDQGKSGLPLTRADWYV